MARIGTVITLKDWLETPKTYHGPINLRYTWPIELTKTYHTAITPGNNSVDRLFYTINYLGNVEHGMRYILELVADCTPGDGPLQLSIFRLGLPIYDFNYRDMEGHPMYEIKITGTRIAPYNLYVRSFMVKWSTGDPHYMQMICRREATVYSFEPQITIYASSIAQRVIRIKTRAYKEVLPKLIKYSK